MAPKVSCEIKAYVDVAYVIHNDSKSQTGVVVYIGKNHGV